MKKVIFLALLVSGISCIAFSQAKITLATQQKTFGGMGGVSMNYTVGFKSKGADSIMIDSVVTIADKTPISIYYNKAQRAYCELAFSQALAPPAKCATCPEVTPKQSNMTKGIIVYYRKGAKKMSFKVKKFKQLPELKLP